MAPFFSKNYKLLLYHNIIRKSYLYSFYSISSFFWWGPKTTQKCRRQFHRSKVTIPQAPSLPLLLKQILAVLRAQLTSVDTNYWNWLAFFLLISVGSMYAKFHFGNGGNRIKVYELPSSSARNLRWSLFSINTWHCCPFVYSNNYYPKILHTNHHPLCTSLCGISFDYNVSIVGELELTLIVLSSNILIGLYTQLVFSMPTIVPIKSLSNLISIP